MLNSICVLSTKVKSKGNENNQHRNQSSNAKEYPLQCKRCNVIFNSPISAQQHFEGRRHAEMVQASPLPLAPRQEQQEEYDLVCQTCDVKFNSQISARQHFTGKKHATNVAEGKGVNTQSTTKRLASDPGSRCNVCNVVMTSATQLEQHNKGARHKLAVERLNQGLISFFFYLSQEPFSNESNIIAYLFIHNLLHHFMMKELRSVT